MFYENRNIYSKITVKQLVKICGMIKGDRKEALKVAKIYNISRAVIDTLRSTLGYTQKNTTYKLTLAQREEIVEGIKNGEHTQRYYAEKYGVGASAIYSLCKFRKVKVPKQNEWTKRQIMKLDILRNQGMGYAQIAPQLGKTEAAVRSKMMDIYGTSKKLKKEKKA